MSTEQNRPVSLPEAAPIHRELTDIVRNNTLEPYVGGRALMMLGFKPVLSIDFPDNSQRKVTLSASSYPWVGLFEQGDSYPHLVTYSISDSQQTPDIQVTDADITAPEGTTDQVGLVERVKGIMDDIKKPETTITSEINVENRNAIQYRTWTDDEGRLHVDVPRLSFRHR